MLLEDPGGVAADAGRAHAATGGVDRLAGGERLLPVDAEGVLQEVFGMSCKLTVINVKQPISVLHVCATVDCCTREVKFVF